jgi:hypothetical protein
MPKSRKRDQVMNWRVHRRNTAHWVDAQYEHAIGEYPVRAMVGGWD